MLTPESPQHVFVCGLIALTIQFVRCSIALIQAVTQLQAKKEKDDNNRALLAKKESKLSTSPEEPSQQHHPTTIAARSSSTSYGSIGDDKGSNNKNKSQNPTVIDEYGVPDEEKQSLIPSFATGVVDRLSAPVVAATSSSASASPPPITTTTTASTTTSIRVIRTIWCVYFVFFFLAWCVQWLRITHTTSSLFMTTIPSTILGITTWIVAFECIYSCSSQTTLMEHYGFIQRWLHILSSIFLGCMILLQLLYNVHYNYTNLLAKNNTSIFDWIFIGAIALYVVCTFIQVQVLLKPPTTAPGVGGDLDGDDAKDMEKRRKGTQFRTSTLRPLLKPYFWPDATSTSATKNRIRAVSTWLCVIVSKACSLISPLYLGWSSTSLAHGQYMDCIKYSVLYSIISWFGTTLKEGQSLVYLEVAQAAFVQLSETAFGHLHTLSLDWHLRKKLGEVIRSMDRGIAACDTLMKYLFLWLLPAIAECVVVCIIFATYFHYLPLAVTVFYFVIVYIVWTITITIWRKQYRKALTKHDNEWHDRFTDSMVNFETVKFFTAEKYEQQRFKQAVEKYQAGSVSVQASLSLLNISQQVILKLCLAVSLSLAAIAIQQRMTCCIEQGGCDSGISDCCQSGLGSQICSNVGMQVGDFVAVLTYTLNLFAPLNFLGSIYNAVVMAVIDLTNMSELLAENPDVTDAPDAIVLPSTPTKDDIVVEFDNVHFHYPTQPITRGLKGLSFKMKRGTTTAIVGPTGAGKTTVSRLLFRFYDVLGGAVKIHGVDVRSITQESLRNAIGVVPQTASMFNDSIRTNLLYGRRDATFEELEQAARDAQLLAFIESLDDGWETLVGDRGLKLSGGERQRAAIARCLLKDPPIVLLDEATSALDTLTEKSVQEALDRLGAERTVLVIAHRLGTIRNADNIIVLKDGVAAEQGTHDELLENNGLYADMWNMQLHSASASASRANMLD